MEEKLEALVERLMEEQRDLIVAAAEAGGMPANKTLDRIALLELNIAAIEHLLDEKP